MATLVFDQEYRLARDTPSDINEHIEVLRTLADSVEHVTEMEHAQVSALVHFWHQMSRFVHMIYS